MIKIRFLRILTYTCVVIAPFSSSSIAEHPDSGRIDTHMHLYVPSANMQVGNRPKLIRNQNTARASKKMMKGGRPYTTLQKPAGSPTMKQYHLAAQNLISRMDARGVDAAVVMPPPQIEGQKGAYSYHAILPAILDSGGRLLLGAGGGSLNPMIVSTNPEKVTEKLKAKFKAAALQMVKDGAVVFGEMTSLHTCMDPRHYYMYAPPDHPLFLLLADISAEADIPIDFHMEAVPEEMKTPNFLIQACGKNPKRLPATIPGLKRLLKHNRKAKIIWHHIGWDNTGHMTPALLGQLLKDNPNLYLSIRVLKPSQAQLENKQDTSITDSFRRIKPQWAKLFEEYPERIMAGGAEFVGAPGNSNTSPETFQETWRLVDQFLEPQRSLISHKNAARIYGIDK